jgi:uncharacterized protein YjbJ (UPF0337 family)
LIGLPPGYADASTDIENASGKMSVWGWKARIKGKGNHLVGALKEQTGHMLDNGQLIAEGLGDKAVGAMQSAEGHAFQTVGEALHLINS